MSCRTRCLTSAKASSDQRRLVPRKVKPRHTTASVRHTRLLDSFTLRLSGVVSKRVRLVLTRSPARLLLTRTSRSSAYLANRWPRRSTSLSRSSNQTLASHGERGEP